MIVGSKCRLAIRPSSGTIGRTAKSDSLLSDERDENRNHLLTTMAC
jgi:hypothetical protein